PDGDGRQGALRQRLARARRARHGPGPARVQGARPARRRATEAAPGQRGAALPDVTMLAAALVLVAAAAPPVAEGKWQTVAPGVEVGRFPAARKAPIGDSVITVVRVDPQLHRFRLLSAKLL